jgi:hypothetical protein
MAPCAKSALGLVEHVVETLNHKFGPRIAHPEQDHTDDLTRAGRQNLSEVKVEGQHDALFPGRLLEDLAVRQPLQSLVAQMNCVVAVTP